jgi:hypothetical protein
MPNTVISLLSSGESGNTPLASALADGELALNFADGIIYYKTATGSLGQFRVVEPSGLDGEIQFNDSGVFGSNASLTFDKTTGVLSTSNVTSDSIATRSYIQFRDGTRQYTANAGEGGGGGTSITVTFDEHPPSSGNTVGDQWIDSSTGVKFEYIDDGDTFQWVEFGTGASANQVIDLTAVTTDIIPVQSNVFDLGSSLYSWKNLYIAGRVSGNLDPITTNTYSLGTSTYQWKDAYLSGNLSISGQVTGNLIPSVTETFDLGSSSNRWKDLYISGTTIDIGGAKIQLHDNTTFTITTHSSANVANPKAFVFTSNGGFGFVDTTAGVISQNTSANIATTFSDSLMSLSSTLTHNVIIRPGRNHLAIGPYVVGDGVEIIIEEGGELTIV